MSADSLSTIVPRLPVPQDWDADARLVARVGGGIGLAQVPKAVHRVRVVAAGERPAAAVAKRVDIGDADRVLQAHQPPADQRPVGPRAGPRDVQVVAAALGREAAGPVGRDPVAEHALLALERAVVVGFAAVVKAVQDEFDQVDWLLAGLTAAGPAFERWLEQLDCLGKGRAGRW
jgi:hypothetical protein